MLIEQEMYARVTEFIQKRFPSGWGGAAVMRTEDNCFLISVALESANGGAVLCMETGALCEAQKYNKKITHSLCVVRETENSPFKVLTPCGICQERLLYWGGDVKVGITAGGDRLEFKTLREVQPYSWTKAYSPAELEHWSGKGASDEA